MKIHNVIASCLAGHTDTEKEISNAAHELLDECIADIHGEVFDGHTHIAGIGNFPLHLYF